MFRHPRTFGERRAAAALTSNEDLTEIGVHLVPRRGRSKESLPSERSDIVARRGRNWKAYRRSQHKSGFEYSCHKCSSKLNV